MFVTILTSDHLTSDYVIEATYKDRPLAVIQIEKDEGYLTELTDILSQMEKIEDFEEEGKIYNQYVIYYDYNFVLTPDSLPTFKRVGFVFDGYSLGDQIITSVVMTEAIVLRAEFTSKKVVFEYTYNMFEGDTELTGYDTDTYGHIVAVIDGVKTDKSEFDVNDNITFEFDNKPGFSILSWRLYKNGSVIRDNIRDKQIADFLISHEDAEDGAKYILNVRFEVESYTMRIAVVSDLPSDDITAEFKGQDSTYIVNNVSPIKVDDEGNDYVYDVEICYPVSHQFDVSKIIISSYDNGVDINGGFDVEYEEYDGRVILHLTHIGATDSSRLSKDRLGNKLIYLVCRVDCKKYIPTVTYIDEGGNAIEKADDIKGTVTFENYSNFVEESGEVIYYYGSEIRMIILTQTGYILRYDQILGEKAYYVLDGNNNKVYVEDISQKDSLSRTYLLSSLNVEDMESLDFRVYFTVTNLNVTLTSYPSNEAELTGGGEIEYGKGTTISCQEVVYRNDVEIYRFVRWEQVNEAGIVIDEPTTERTFTVNRVESNLYFRAVYSFRVEVAVTNEDKNAGEIGVVPVGTKVDLTTKLFDHIYIEPKQSVIVVIESGVGYKIGSVDNITVEKQYISYETSETIRDLVQTITFDEVDSTYSVIGVTFISKPVTVKVASNESEGTLDEVVPTNEQTFGIGDVIELKVIPNTDAGYKFDHWNTTSYGDPVTRGEDYDYSGQAYYTISPDDAEYGTIYFTAQYEKIKYSLKIIQNYYDNGKVYVSNVYKEYFVGYGADQRITLNSYNANTLLSVVSKNLTTGESLTLTSVTDDIYSYDFIRVDTSYEITATYSPVNWTDGYSVPSGNGTKDSPYLITTAEELAYVAYMVNSGEDNGYNKAYFSLENDIDLSGKFWSPIGINSEGKVFQGVFNFNYHSVTNINYDRSWLTVYNNGLFGAISKNAVIYSGSVRTNYTAVIIVIISIIIIIATIIGYWLYKRSYRKKLMLQGNKNLDDNMGLEELKDKIREKRYLKKAKKEKERLEKQKAKNNKLRGIEPEPEEDDEPVIHQSRSLSRNNLTRKKDDDNK